MSDYFNSAVTSVLKVYILQFVSNYDNSLTKRKVATVGIWSIHISVKKILEFSQKVEGFKFF